MKQKKEILFKNETKCTKQEYEDFLESYSKEYIASETVYTISNIIFFSVCVLGSVLYKEYTLTVFLIIGIILYILYKFVRPNLRIKKERNSDKIKFEFLNTFLFYKNYFSVENKDGNAIINYFNLYKVVETESHFYIYISRDYAFIISKKGFIDSTSYDFSDFIQKKVKFKYKKR